MSIDVFDRSESLRFCEDFIGQPRDFPKKQSVVLPKPEPKEIPPEETWQGLVAETHRVKNDCYYRCSTCRFDNGTAVCEKRRKDHKVSLCHEYKPDSYCFDYKPDWKKIFPNMRRL